MLERLGTDRLPLAPRAGADLRPGSSSAALLESPSRPPRSSGSRSSDPLSTAARSLARRAAGTQSRSCSASLFDLDLRPDLRWKSAARSWSSAIPPGSPPPRSVGWQREPPAKRNVKTLRGLDASPGRRTSTSPRPIWLKLIDELAPERPDDRAPLQDVGGPEPSSSSPSGGRCRSTNAAIYGSTPAMVRRRGRGLPVSADSRGGTDGSRGFPSSPGSTPDAPRTVDGLRQGTAGRRSSMPATVLASRLGTCPLTWRQGLKHDAAAVMELTWRRASPARCGTGLGEGSTSSPRSSTRCSRGPTWASRTGSARAGR